MFHTFLTCSKPQANKRNSKRKSAMKRGRKLAITRWIYIFRVFEDTTVWRLQNKMFFF